MGKICGSNFQLTSRTIGQPRNMEPAWENVTGRKFALCTYVIVPTGQAMTFFLHFFWFLRVKSYLCTQN